MIEKFITHETSFLYQSKKRQQTNKHFHQFLTANSFPCFLIELTVALKFDGTKTTFLFLFQITWFKSTNNSNNLNLLNDQSFNIFNLMIKKNWNKKVRKLYDLINSKILRLNKSIILTISSMLFIAFMIEQKSKKNAKPGNRTQFLDTEGPYATNTTVSVHIFNSLF